MCVTEMSASQSGKMLIKIKDVVVSVSKSKSRQEPHLGTTEPPSVITSLCSVYRSNKNQYDLNLDADHAQLIDVL